MKPLPFRMRGFDDYRSEEVETYNYAAERVSKGVWQIFQCLSNGSSDAALQPKHSA